MQPSDDDPLPGFDALYDEAACGLVLTDRDGTIRRVNLTFCRWIGIGRDELVDRRRYQDLLDMGGKIFHQTHWSPLLQMQDSIAEVKVHLMHRDGRAIPMMMNAVSRTYAQVTFHELALFVAEDRHKYERELLLARKQAEQSLARQEEAQKALTLADARLRVALEAARLHVWEVDPLSGERRYAPGVAALLGMEAPCPVDAERFVAAIDPVDRDREAAAFSRLLDASPAAYRCEHRLNGADGVQRTLLATAQIVAGEHGRTSNIVGVLQDITELSRQRAVAEDRALFAEQMIGIVSHDLRNPLSAIMLGAGMLEAVELAPKRLRTLGHINQAARRAQRMIADLLDFTLARIGRGLSVRVEPIDLHAAVAECVDELALAHPGRTLLYRSHGTGVCAADADRLYQLVGNLVANAVSYGTTDAPIQVTSSIEATQFLVTVHNMGHPISRDALPNLFKPMVRGTDAPSAARSVGLGLYIVREIARAHRGDMMVSSTATEGTTFTAIFPRGATDASHRPL